MKEFREKWIWALCLAILVHACVFFIIYLNSNKDSSVEVSNTQEISNEANNSIKASEAIAITNLESTKDSNILMTGSEKVETIADTDEATTSANQSTNNATTTITNTGKHSDLKPKKEALSLSSDLNTSKDIEYQRDAIIISNDPINEATLEEIKNNAGLLDMDVPTQKTEIKIDQEYKNTKSEVENTNNQLSNAINEFKKRNQQKIEQMQQQ